VPEAIESVVEREDEHVLIEKTGAAAQIVAALDPRA